MARKPPTQKQLDTWRANGFKPGQSGNPKGRPVEDAALKGQIRQNLPAMIDRLVEIATNGKNEASQVKAIEAMMSYVMPKAATKVDVDVQVTHVADLLAKAARARTVNVIEAEVLPIGIEATESTHASQDD